MFIWWISSFEGLLIADAKLHDFCLLEIGQLLLSNGRFLKDFVSLLQPYLSNSSLSK